VQQIYALAPPFAPVFYTQPQSSANYVHDSIAFSALADGTDPLTFQWKKNGNDIPGATGTSLALADLQFADAGNYSLAVTNPVGFANSSAATLTVLSLPPPNLTNELIAYWAFDETVGASAADSSGRGNSASLLEFPVDDSQWVSGVIGGALHFSTNNGAGNYRVASDVPIVFDNDNQFSFSFWAKRDPGPTGTNPRILALFTGQSWVAWTPGRGVGFLTPAVSTEPSVNSWHHFVVIYDRVAGSYSLYVDGIREVSNAAGYPRNDPNTPAQYWFIGHSETAATTTDSFTGLLDDVRIYNRLLNYNDIQALYLTAGQPRLTVSGSGSSVTLSWPVGAIGFTLYSANTVTGNAWSPVGITPTTSADGATQSVTVTVTSGNKFYRLQKP
jgi:Concanavalin A-like lectin/glucanases superfamily/Immunoglobulin I-set domain